MATRQWGFRDDMTAGAISVTWEPGANVFNGWIAAPNDDQHRVNFNGQAPYWNEQGNPENDNGVAKCGPLRSGANVRIRVLFSLRKDDPFFHDAGDVITAYTPHNSGEGSWVKVGNVLTG